MFLLVEILNLFCGWWSPSIDYALIDTKRVFGVGLLLFFSSRSFCLAKTVSPKNVSLFWESKSVASTEASYLCALLLRCLMGTLNAAVRSNSYIFPFFFFVEISCNTPMKIRSLVYFFASFVEIFTNKIQFLV